MQGVDPIEWDKERTNKNIKNVHCTVRIIKKMV